MDKFVKQYWFHFNKTFLKLLTVDFRKASVFVGVYVYTHIPDIIQ